MPAGYNAEIGRTPRRDRSASAARSVVIRIEIGSSARCSTTAATRRKDPHRREAEGRRKKTSGRRAPVGANAARGGLRWSPGPVTARRRPHSTGASQSAGSRSRARRAVEPPLHRHPDSPRLVPIARLPGMRTTTAQPRARPAPGRPLSAQSAGSPLLGSRRPNGRSGSATFAPAPTPRRERRGGSPRCGPCRSDDRARCRAWLADGGYGHRPCASRRCNPRPTPHPEAPRGSAPAPD